MGTSPKTHLLRKLNSQDFDDKPFWVVDIETGKPGDDDTFGGQFVCAQMRKSDDIDTSYWFYDEGELIHFLLSRKCRGCRVYAHNGAGYDYKYLIRYLSNHKEEFDGVSYKCLPRKDGRIICMTLCKNKHAVKLLDTFHIFPQSLRKFTEVFAPEFVKHEREWKNEETGEIYWFNPDDPTDREYLDYDCIGLIKALERFKRMIHDHFGINITMTAAGTAMKAWRVTIPRDECYWRPREEVEHFIRKSYAGGYVFLTETNRLYDRVHVDINAAYAASMRLGVPVGTAAHTEKWWEGYPGFYRCRVYAPTDERYPIVPRKTDAGLQWNVGEWEQILPSCTIEYAQKHGYRFEIIEGYVYDKIAFPFQTFLERCEALEIKYKGHETMSGIAECAKLLRNSLYGRFGMNPVAERMIFSADPTDDMQPFIDKQTNEIVEDFFVEEELLSVPSMQIHWASWITAQTRIRVHEIAKASGASYGDTDSADMSKLAFKRLLKDGIIKLGNRYGEVKIEHEFEWFEAHAPKDYIGYMSDKEWAEYQAKHPGCSEEERYVHRAKAMPRGKIISTEHINAPVQNTTKTYRSMVSFETQIKHPDSPLAIERRRSYSTLAHSVSWRQGEKGQVLPIEVHLLTGT